MSKLKAGDRVFVTARYPNSVLWNAQGTVDRAFTDESCLVLLDGESRGLPFDRGEVEILTFDSQRSLRQKKIYIIGSLRNPAVSVLAQNLRTQFPGVEVFDDWMAAGPEADDYWRDYEKAKGNTLAEALKGHAARHVFEYDKGHLDSSDVVILALPAGKSGHLELGYSIGKGKKSAILLDAQPDRFDVMYGFADLVTDKLEELTAWLKEVL